MDKVLFENLACGGVGGVCQVLVGHPFDTLKVRLQMGHRVGGYGSLYKGVTSPLLATSLCNAIVFGAYHNIGLPLSSNAWISGGIAGAIASFAYCPMELYKIQSQLFDTTGWVKLLRPARWLNPFHGWTLTLLRDVPSFSAYFGLHEFLESKGCGQVVAGGFAGVAAWLACYPIDVVKTMYQSSLPSSYQCAALIYERHGLKGFFNGLSPALLRTFPASAITFSVFEFMRGMLNDFYK